MTGRPARVGDPVDRGRILLGLHAGRRWIYAAAGLGLVAAIALATWVAPSLYVARTAVVFEQAVPVESEAEASRQLRTMVDGIVMPQNLIEIRRREGLEDDLTELSARLSIDYDRESNLVTIGAMDRNPQRAASLANTAASVFVAHRRAFEADRRKELVQALDDDLARARNELSVARDEYDAFRRQHGIADLSAETQRAIETAAALRAQADMAQGDVAAEESRARTQRSQGRRVSASGAPMTAEQQAVESRLAQARVELVEAKTRYSSLHPEVQRLEAMIRALRAQRAATAAVPRQDVVPERVAVDTSPATSGRSAAALERQRTYSKLAGEAQEQLQRLSQQQGEAARLLAGQQIAEAHLSELTAMRSRVIDEARSPVAGLRVLSAAVPPERAEASLAKPILFFIALPLLFALLATVILVVRQFARLRVHTAREVAFWGRGVTVASTRWPSGQESLDTLIAEIADEATVAKGSTLIVPTRPGDAFLARALAADLNAATSAPAKTDGHAVQVVLVPAPPIRRETIPLGLPATPESLMQGAGRATIPFMRAVTPPPEVPPGVVTEAAPAAVATQGALALRLAEPQEFRVKASWRSPEPTFSAWGGPLSGASLRRLARLADRVLILVRSGSTSIAELAKVRANIGRDGEVGFVLLDLDEELEELPDRAGAVDEYWRGSRE